MTHSPSWQGINHLALITEDMDATTRFWHEVLGAELVATVATDSFKHYFFRIGPAQTVAFFQYTGVELDAFSKPAGMPYHLASQFDHLSLGLPDEEALEDLRRRLKAHGCEVTDVVDHGFIRSIYFTDPTGISLEASYWVTPLPEHADLTDGTWFHDREPVASVKELEQTGLIGSTPATSLVDGIVER